MGIFPTTSNTLEIFLIVKYGRHLVGIISIFKYLVSAAHWCITWTIYSLRHRTKDIFKILLANFKKHKSVLSWWLKTIENQWQQKGFHVFILYYLNIGFRVGKYLICLWFYHVRYFSNLLYKQDPATEFTNSDPLHSMMVPLWHQK